VSLETDGCLRNGRDVAIAACLGAEMFGFATAPLIAVGCIMMRKCHLNTCPVGIATQDEELRKKFQGTPEHVMNYLFLVAEECREIMAKLGVRSIPELVGRCDLLKPNEAVLKSDPKFANLDLRPLILPAKALRGTILNVRDRDQWLTENHKIQNQDHGLEASVPSGVRALDHHIITSILAAVNGIPFAAHGEFPLEHHLACSRLVGGVTGLYSSEGDARTFHDAIERIRKMDCHVEVDIPAVGNMNRAVGTIVSNEMAKLLGEDATVFGTKPIRDGSIVLRCKGHAGQSFGAFLAKGVDMRLEGDTNDYCGKGLSGGEITVYPPRDTYFKAEENVIIGNVCLYGATGGRLFARGIAAERFAVRNSGAWAVVEGTGDHGCEYMTGGRVVVLGSVGINFGAGMSGGRAYLWDPKGDAVSKCTKEEDPKKEYGPVTDPEHVAELRGLIEEHLERTKSTVAAEILSKWAESLPKFLLAFPLDFKRAIETEKKAKAEAAKDPVAALSPDEKELIGVNPAPDAAAKVIPPSLSDSHTVSIVLSASSHLDIRMRLWADGMVWGVCCVGCAGEGPRGPRAQEGAAQQGGEAPQAARLHRVRARGGAVPAGGGAGQGLHGDLRGPGRGEAGDAGGAVHELRGALLQPERDGLPAGQQDPRVERARLRGALAGGPPAPPHDQQLPRVHGPRLPCAVRGGVRAGHHRAARDDQEHRVRHHRQGLRGGLDRALPPPDAHRQEGGHHRLRAGRARGGGPAQQGGALGDGV
jgi:glutamate synthase domain-containing protein 3